MPIPSRKATSNAYTRHTESLRASWVTKVHGIIMRQLDTYRADHQSSGRLIAGRIQADRDAWVTLITRVLDEVGQAFSAKTLATLVQRAGAKDFTADSPTFAAAYEGFMRTYVGAYASAQADRVLGALDARLSDLVSHASKARTPARPSPASGAAFSDDTGDDGDGDTDGGGEDDSGEGVVAPDFDSLLDDVFDGAALVLGGLLVGLGSGLGPMASANAFSEDQDIELIKIWTAIEDSATRPDHSEADGQEQPLDEPFDVGGSQLMFPGDESMGADFDEIIYCRCVVEFDVSGAKRRALRLDWAERLRDLVVAGEGQHV